MPSLSTLHADVMLTVNPFALKQGPGRRSLSPVGLWHDSVTGMLPLKKRAKLVARKHAPSPSAVPKDARFAYYEPEGIVGMDSVAKSPMEANGKGFLDEQKESPPDPDGRMEMDPSPVSDGWNSPTLSVPYSEAGSDDTDPCPSPVRNFITTDSGMAVAVTMNQEKSGLEASVVPIVRGVVNGQSCSVAPVLDGNISIDPYTGIGDSLVLSRKDSNKLRWEEVESILHLFKDSLLHYSKDTPYDANYGRLSGWIQQVKMHVLSGHMSPQFGITQCLNFIRRLIDQVQNAANACPEKGDAMAECLKKLICDMNQFETNVISTGYYDDEEGLINMWFAFEEDDDIADREVAAANDGGGMAKGRVRFAFEEDDVIADGEVAAANGSGDMVDGRVAAENDGGVAVGVEAAAANDSDNMVDEEMVGHNGGDGTVDGSSTNVGYVGEIDTFGDAEISESNKSSEFSSIEESIKEEVELGIREEARLAITTPVDGLNELLEDTVKDIKLNGKRVCSRQREFTKKLKPYNLGISLLPSRMKGQVKKCINENMDAISDRGYTSKDAFLDVWEKWGPLRSDAEMRRLFMEITYASDLDG